MRKFRRQLERLAGAGIEVAYVHGSSSLSPLEWIEDTAFREAAARYADPGLELVFRRARQVGVAFVRSSKR
jgi:hypothetical protein